MTPPSCPRCGAPMFAAGHLEPGLRLKSYWRCHACGVTRSKENVP